MGAEIGLVIYSAIQIIILVCVPISIVAYLVGAATRKYYEKKGASTNKTEKMVTVAMFSTGLVTCLVFFAVLSLFT